MSNPHVCPYCSSEDDKLTVPMPKVRAQFYFCTSCGVVFKDLDQESHGELAGSVYSVQSWGVDRQQSINAHGPRLKGTLDWYHNRSALAPSDHYLDIGAGVGVLVHYLCEEFKIKPSSISAVEPVKEIAALLQSEYPDTNVLHADLEQLTPEKFLRELNAVFCFGVDYLFKDLNQSFGIIKSLLPDGGRMMISRNVFLNMPCFFGGVPIQNYDQLFGPNPLISFFMFPDQYKELLGRWFKIDAGVIADEKYQQAMRHDAESGQNIPIDNQVKGKIALLDCRVEHSYDRSAEPILNPERGLQRLRQLGVQV